MLQSIHCGVITICYWEKSKFLWHIAKLLRETLNFSVFVSFPEICLLCEDIPTSLIPFSPYLSSPLCRRFKISESAEVDTVLRNSAVSEYLENKVGNKRNELYLHFEYFTNVI